MERLVLFLIGITCCWAKSSVRSTFPCASPKYWCRDEQTAQECHALEYCLQQWGTKRTVPDAEPITVALYYESLCPGCRYFLTNGMYPAFQKLSSSGILRIELYPYGNARETQQGGKYIFDCQHGPGECTGNIIETCAIHIMPNSTHYFPFIYCMESNEPTEKQARACAKQLGIEYDQIDACVKGSEGNYLEHQMAVKTNALQPPHDYVPWITVDGKHTDEIQNAVEGNMFQYVCQHYKGTPPAVCSEARPKPCTNHW